MASLVYERENCVAERELKENQEKTMTARNTGTRSVRWFSLTHFLLSAFRTPANSSYFSFPWELNIAGVQLRVHNLQVQNLLQLFSVLDTYCSLSSWFAELQSEKTQDTLNVF